MRDVTVSEAFRLPAANRIRLAQALWDSVADNPEQVPLTASQIDELEACYADYLARPNEGSLWSEVKARLTSRE